MQTPSIDITSAMMTKRDTPAPDMLADRMRATLHRSNSSRIIILFLRSVDSRRSSAHVKIKKLNLLTIGQLLNVPSIGDSQGREHRPIRRLLRVIWKIRSRRCVCALPLIRSARWLVPRQKSMYTVVVSSFDVDVVSCPYPFCAVIVFVSNCRPPLSICRVHDLLHGFTYKTYDSRLE